jgi:invasion protein IalB
MSKNAAHRHTIWGALVLAGLLAAGGPVQAQAQKAATAAATPIGQFGDWQAFQTGSAKTLVCFVISRPKTRAPEGLNRDPASFFITHRPGQGVKNEISIIAGFPMKEGQDALVKIGATTFSMFTKEANAWVKNASEEPAVLTAMKKGKALTFEGTSRRGNVTTDTYSLAGLSDALDAVSKSCQ